MTASPTLDDTSGAGAAIASLTPVPIPQCWGSAHLSDELTPERRKVLVPLAGKDTIWLQGTGIDRQASGPRVGRWRAQGFIDTINFERGSLVVPAVQAG
jgi:hypothetical protein